MTTKAKKPEYVTREEFKEWQYNQEEKAPWHHIHWSYLYFLGVAFVLIFAIASISNNAVSQTNGIERFCAQNELTPVCTGVPSGTAVDFKNCHLTSMDGYVWANETIYKVGRCLDWKWRDKI